MSADTFAPDLPLGTPASDEAVSVQEGRKDVDEFRDSLAHIAEEATVRQLAENLNHRIREVNRTTVSGPPTTVAPFDVDRLVETWRTRRAE